MRHSPCCLRNRLGRVRDTSSGRLGIRPRWSSMPLGATNTDCGGRPGAAAKSDWRGWFWLDAPPIRSVIASLARFAHGCKFFVCPRLFESGNRGPRARVVVSSKSGRPPQVGTSGVIGAQARQHLGRSGHPSAEADDCASCRLASKEFDIPVLSRPDCRRNRKLTPSTPPVSRYRYSQLTPPCSHPRLACHHCRSNHMRV
jgi:hypothetical protein